MAKIRSIEVEEYAWDRKVPITDGKLTYPKSGIMFVKVTTEDGISGLGIANPGKMLRTIVEEISPILIGKDPMDVERHWDDLWIPKLVGRRGLTTRAISALDIALWDIRAQLASVPLYKLLGGYRDSIPTYIAGGYYQEGKGLDELAAEMQTNVEMGARAVKMKVGAASVREDAERVRIAREAVGPSVRLMIDANCAYRSREAIQLARLVEDFDIFWFEEPVAPDDYDGHRRVADASSIPVATGENEYTLFGFRDLVLHGSASILNANATILGGVTEFMKVAAVAQAHGLEVAPHGTQDVHIHLVTAINNGLMLEFYRDTHDDMWRHIYENPLLLNEDGTVSPREAPGLGLRPNYEALNRFRVH